MKKSHIAIIGVILSIAIVLLIWGMNFLSGKNIFKSENEFYVVYSRVDGLTESSPVTISGFKVGQVRKISFLPDFSGKILVKIVVHNKYKVRKNAVAELYSSDIMGTKAVKILHGTSEEFHASGDTLKDRVEGELIDMVSMTMLPLKVKAENMLSSVDSVLTVVRYIFNKNAQESINKSFATINRIIQNMESTSFQMDKIVRAEKEKMSVILTNLASITSNLKENNEKISSILANFDAISDSLARSEIKQTIDNTKLMTTQLNELVAKINSGEGTMGKLLHNDTLYTHLQDASYNLNRLLRDLVENPKRYLHFSAFDLGKTIYVGDGKTKYDEDTKRKKKKKKKK